MRQVKYRSRTCLTHTRRWGQDVQEWNMFGADFSEQRNRVARPTWAVKHTRNVHLGSRRCPGGWPGPLAVGCSHFGLGRPAGCCHTAGFRNADLLRLACAQLSCKGSAAPSASVPRHTVSAAQSRLPCAPTRRKGRDRFDGCVGPRDTCLPGAAIAAAIAVLRCGGVGVAVTGG